MKYNKTPQTFYTDEEYTFECPRGHKVQKSPMNADVQYPVPASMGFCSSCRSDWRDWVAENEDRIEDLVDDPPENPSYFEMLVQRVADHNRTGESVDTDDAVIPSKKDWTGIVTWRMAEPEKLPGYGDDDA